MKPEKDLTMNADAAAAAEALEQAANRETGTDPYVHHLSKPLQWEGRTMDTLTFQWDALTGADHLDIERELLMKGVTLVVPAYTGEYLLGMAVRACTERTEMGLPVFGPAVLKSLPLNDFITICNRARRFLLRSGSLPETADNGSESDA